MTMSQVERNREPYIQAWVEFTGTTFEDYEYSAGWEAFGWILELTPIIMTVLFPLYLIFKLSR